MTDLEDQLRTELHRAAADTPTAAVGLDAVRAHVDRRAHRARHQRRALVGVVAVFALAAGTVALRGGDGTERTTAASDATPRDGIPGWRQIAPLTLGERFQHQAVAIGGEVLVFDGYDGIGDTEQGSDGAAIYDPVSGRWREAASPPTGRWSWSVVADDAVYAISVDRGLVARYDVSVDAWSELPDPGFGEDHMTLGAAWTGEQLLVLVQGHQEGDGVATPSWLTSYDPQTDSWSEPTDAPDSDEIDAFNTMAWTGTELLVASDAGGSGKSYEHLSLLRWSPDDGWSSLPTPPLSEPTRRGGSYLAWTGAELVVGGGNVTSAAAEALSAELVAEDREPTEAERELLLGHPAYDVAAWDAATDTWRQLPDAPVPVYNDSWRYPGVFTDREVVVWELDPGTLASTGRLALLDPSTGAWRLSDPAPGGMRQVAPMTWTGHELVIAGGEPTEGDREPMGCCDPTDSVIAFTP